MRSRVIHGLADGTKPYYQSRQTAPTNTIILMTLSIRAVLVGSVCYLIQRNLFSCAVEMSMSNSREQTII